MPGVNHQLHGEFIPKRSIKDMERVEPWLTAEPVSRYWCISVNDCVRGNREEHLGATEHPTLGHAIAYGMGLLKGTAPGAIAIRAVPVEGCTGSKEGVACPFTGDEPVVVRGRLAGAKAWEEPSWRVPSEIRATAGGEEGD